MLKDKQIFVEKLCQEIAGHKNITIDTYKICGKKATRRIESLKFSLEPTSPFFVLLYDCNNFSMVVSDIKKQHKSLTEKGYEKIICVRDLLPVSLAKKEELEKGIKGALKSCNQSGVKISVILAVMEIEAWFLAEWHYLAKIDSRLSPEFIKQQCGIDLKNDLEKIPHPSTELDKIYRLIGKFYDKTEATAK
ncbi:MAG: hypothetical protein Fur0025_39000 [Oscillatoriaceae cyanobacterium]